MKTLMNKVSKCNVELKIKIMCYMYQAYCRVQRYADGCLFDITGMVSICFILHSVMSSRHLFSSLNLLPLQHLLRDELPLWCTLTMFALEVIGEVIFLSLIYFGINVCL